MSSSLKIVRSQRGRPQKFGRPARTVALTLPEDIIAALTLVDADLGRAVVNVSQPLVEHAVPRPAAELSKYGHSAVIVIKPVAALERISGVTLVPLPDGRALISLDETMAVYEFELKLRDVLDEKPTGESLRDRKALAAIADILKMARSTRDISVHRRSIIVLQSTRRGRIGDITSPATTARR
jgi:hypothetical protein